MEIVPKPTKKRAKFQFPRPTVRLSRRAMARRRRLLDRWEFSPDELDILDETLAVSDLIARYQETLDAAGLSILNEKTGASRPSPVLSALKAARSHYVALYRLLGLKDDGERRPVGRPPITYPEQ
jgi:hypothetical protein